MMHGPTNIKNLYVLMLYLSSINKSRQCIRSLHVAAPSLVYTASNKCTRSNTFYMFSATAEPTCYVALMRIE